MINLKASKWELNNIQTILFDKDGTFIDLNQFWGKMTEMRVQEVLNYTNSNQELFSDLCLSLGYDVLNKKMLKDGITALYSRIKIISIFKSDLEKFGINITENELEKIFDKVSANFNRNILEYTKPIDEAINFIREVRKYGVKTAVVTADSVETTKLVVKNFGWENLFDVIVGRESSKSTKESGEPAKIALKKLGANSDTTIMIGDAPTDFICAKNAGIEKTILVATGQIEKTDLSNFSEYIVQNLSELMILQSLDIK
ncbi:MAG: HAD family hydrolase [Cyanobacteria bacterium SIG28]|nr:HAD family hydrolase [Cyanobacteria bacterium SIG28]